jgi:hypothetical protein
MKNTPPLRVVLFGIGLNTYWGNVGQKKCAFSFKLPHPQVQQSTKA